MDAEANIRLSHQSFAKKIPNNLSVGKRERLYWGKYKKVMPPRKLCEQCHEAPASMKRPRNAQLLCKSCFFTTFEDEIHQTITTHNLFSPGDTVACGASGGKDSTVLMHLIKTLNDKHHYGIKIVLVSIDEGIKGYRDDSLQTVHRNAQFYNLPLRILSYKDVYGWTMDEIVEQIGSKSNCTFCGVFRRQALDRGATLVGANKIVTGHNADDTAETILMNFLRADTPRLTRCINISTDKEGMTPRVKPLKYAYEKEIVLYAHFKHLDYFTTECTYSKEAFRGTARSLLKDLEAIRPRCIIDIIYSGENISMSEGGMKTVHSQTVCVDCGYITSQLKCRACVLLEALNSGAPKVGLTTVQGGGTPKKKRM